MERKRKREKAGANGLDIQEQEQKAPPLSAETPQVSSPQRHEQGKVGSQATVPYWGELPPRPPYFPGPPGSTTDPGWQPPPPSQVSASGAPLGPYGFPPPGAWFYPPPFGYFGYPIPANPSNPAAHKGFIKTPQGLSQKHQKLWEVQSTENIQLWAALARAEAELATQRTRLAQLETEIQTLKSRTSNQDKTNETVAVTAALPAATATTTTIGAVTAATTTMSTTTTVVPPLQPAKRGRYRKPVIGNIPPEAIAPRPRGRKPSSDKLRQARQLMAGLSATDSHVGLAGSSMISTEAVPACSLLAPLNGSSSSGVPKVAMSAETGLQHKPAAVTYDPSGNKLRGCLRENGGGRMGYNAGGTVSGGVGGGGGGGGEKQAVNWAPVIQIARTSRGSDEDDEEDEDHEGKLLGLEPVVPPVPSGQAARWQI